MRYIADSNGYLLEVSFGAEIVCNDTKCTEYTGDVPEGYSSLANWFAAEGERLYCWYLVDGQLTLDPDAAAPAVAVVEPVLRMAKLWENETPTATFYSQTVALDLSEYDAISLYYKNVPSGAVYFSTGPVLIGSRVTMQYVSTSGDMYHRHADVRATGIVFGAGQLNGEASNNAPVPCIVFGWKGLIGVEPAQTVSAVCGDFICGAATCGI